jgi:S-adenosylmethionine synthetase
MAIDYTWCKFAKEMKKSIQKEFPNIPAKIVPNKVKIEKPLKAKTQLKAKTKLKSKTPVKKVSKHKETVTKKTYNAVLERDKQCRMKDMNCKGKLQLHHINRSW